MSAPDRVRKIINANKWFPVIIDYSDKDNDFMLTKNGQCWNRSTSFLKQISNEVDKKTYFWYDPKKWIGEIISKFMKERKENIRLKQEIQKLTDANFKLMKDIERYERLKKK